MPTESNAPTVTVDLPKSLTIRGLECPLQLDQTREEHYAIFRDEKLGELKVWIKVFNKGDKAGMKYCVAEYPGFQSIIDRFGSDTVADMANNFLANKTAQRVNAFWNSKTNAKLVKDDQIRINLEMISQKDNWLNAPDEALDLNPFERGESMSGLQREQREILSQMREAQEAKNFTLVTQLIVRMQEIGARMVEFIQKQTEEYNAMGEAIASGAVKE